MEESTFTCLTLLLIFLTDAGLRLLRRPLAEEGLLVRCSADEDIRLVTGSPSDSLRAASDSGESVAQEFQRQKENGNIFMAKRLGEELARPLLAGEPELFGGLWEDYTGQMGFLYALAVREAVELKIGNAILADTVLHSFSETIENGNGTIYRALNDSEAETIYRLCLADGEDIGRGFAKLCGSEQDAQLAAEGAGAFRRFRAFSTRRIDRIPFR